MPYIILGNKNDLDNATVSIEEVEKLNNFITEKLNHQKDNFVYMKTSAVTGENINEAFNFLVQKLTQ
jgi:GTPase SAR1 family protein